MNVSAMRKEKFQKVWKARQNTSRQIPMILKAMKDGMITGEQANKRLTTLTLKERKAAAELREYDLDQDLERYKRHQN